MRKYGTRQEVYNLEAQKTRGGLTKADLMVSKTGKIVSKKKSMAAAESYKKFGFKKRQDQVEEKVEERSMKNQRKKEEDEIKKSQSK